MNGIPELQTCEDAPNVSPITGIEKRNQRNRLRFEKKLKNKYGNRFTLLSGHINTRSKVKIRCNECKTVMERPVGQMMYRGTCRRCFNIRRTKTDEEFMRQMLDKYGGKFTLLSKYITSGKKIKVRHNECGAEYEIVADSLLHNGGCRVCQYAKMRKRLTKTKEEFIRQVELLGAGEYSFLGDYINANIPALFRHNKCGREYMAKPNGFIQGKRCRKCANEGRKIKDKTNKIIAKRLRGRINSALRGRTKTAPMLSLLGCSIKDFKSYLEGLFLDEMNWSNYGKNGWELDHKRPCASFDLRDDKQQRECFHYTNLQPLWAKDNWVKHSYWNGKHHRKEHDESLQFS